MSLLPRIALLCVASTACAPPVPVLAKLSAPVLTVQRRMSGPLLVVLSYDEQKTPCGAVERLHASLDGVNLDGSAGRRVVSQTDGSESCEFPYFSGTPAAGAAPREIVLTDDVTTLAMTLDTLEVGSASAESPPATLHSGYALRWNAFPPRQGTSSFNVLFTPEGGSAVTWFEGTQLPSTFTVTVPPITAAASGKVAATWLVNAAVTRCEGVASCSATLQGAGTLSAVVAP